MSDVVLVIIVATGVWYVGVTTVLDKILNRKESK